MPEPRLELTRIERCLRAVQRDFAKINATLNSRRDTLDDDVVANMLTGYAYLNSMLEQGHDPFKRGQHGHLLELNTIVLCGHSLDERRRFHRHIEATEATSTRFQVAAFATSRNGMRATKATTPGKRRPVSTSAR